MNIALGIFAGIGIFAIMLFLKAQISDYRRRVSKDEIIATLAEHPNGMTGPDLLMHFGTRWIPPQLTAELQRDGKIRAQWEPDMKHRRFWIKEA